MTYDKRIISLVLLFLEFIIIIKINNNNLIEEKLRIVNQLNGKFTDLYFYMRNKINITPDFKANKIYENKKNKILLCTIGKMENLYAKEFVEYYFYLGFDKIVILDNNDLKGEKFNVVLNDFIAKKIVEIKDIRGLKYIQIPSYNYCYQKYNYLYDWIAFFDFDEFLFIKNKTNIKDYLYDNKFKKCQSVLLNWHIYDDNNLLKKDNRTIISRFTNMRAISWATKFIVRGNIDNLLITSSHIPVNINYCNSKGEFIFPKSYSLLHKENNSISYLKHYYTKTAEEYCNKINKGDVQFQNINSKNEFIKKKINIFFYYNKKTKEKIELLKQCIKIN